MPGCAIWFDFFPPEGESAGDVTAAFALEPFESEEELVDYYVQQITARSVNSGGAQGGARDDESDAVTGGGAESDEALPSPPAAEPAAGGAGELTADEDGSSNGHYSQTTTQEEGVDEADVVKSDGTYFYIISDGTLKIVRASPPEQLAVLGTFPLEGHGREIYLYGTTVVALTETYGGFFYLEPVLVVAPAVDMDGVVAAAEEPEGGQSPSDESEASEPATNHGYEKPRVYVTIIDVSTPTAPTLVSQTAFDGAQSSSRMIDGVLYLVISNIEGYLYDLLPVFGGPEPEPAEVDVEGLLPRYAQTDATGGAAEGALLTWREMYRPNDPGGFGVVTVVSMDVNNGADFHAVGIVAEPGLIYSSPQALYVTNTEWDLFWNHRETTDVYKFAYVDGGTIPAGTGTVPGRILNQYSMGEYKGYLRVATTVGPTFLETGERTESHNNVYVLEEVDGELQVVGSVEDIAPRETIQAARFIGDRGFVVTFEQIDPLFTLDLSDPTDPQVMGSLEVPGFSTFIVPLDADHLLTVGQYIPPPPQWGPWGVQLSIFDVSNFRDPVRSRNVIIGGEDAEAWSEALYNPKAFTYYAEGGLVALPVSIYGFSDFPVRTDDLVPVEVIDGVRTDADAAPESEPMTAEEAAEEEEEEDEEPDAPPPPETDAEGMTEAIEPYIRQGFDGLMVYRVSAENGIDELGRISTRFEDLGDYSGSFTRGMFIGDNVYAVTDVGIRAAPVEAIVEPAPYELVIGLPDWYSNLAGDEGSGTSSGSVGSAGGRGDRVDAE